MSKRWHATAIYRTEFGPAAVTHSIEKLSELHQVIERGPNWNTLISITVCLVTHAGMTIEMADNDNERLTQ